MRRCLADQSHDRLDGVCDLAVLHGIDISVLFVEDMVDGFQQSGVGQLFLLKKIAGNGKSWRLRSDRRGWLLPGAESGYSVCAVREARRSRWLRRGR